MKQENDRQLNERVAKLEVGLINVCDALHDIKTNELVHINTKIDKLDERFDILDKKVGELALKIGIVFAVLTIVGQTLLNYFLK
jgi:hypothetical protein